MNFRHLILRTTLESDLTFDQFYNQMKRVTGQGVRFKLGVVDREYICVYYHNDYANSGYYEKLGMDIIPGIQVTAERSWNAGAKTLINFKVANYVLVVWATLCLVLFGLLTYQFQVNTALVVLLIFLVLSYFLQLWTYSKQLFYFKYDLDSLLKTAATEKYRADS